MAEKDNLNAELEAINKAIKIELDIRKFYLDNAEKMKNELAKKTFIFLMVAIMIVSFCNLFFMPVKGVASIDLLVITSSELYPSALDFAQYRELYRTSFYLCLDLHGSSLIFQ